MMNRVSDKLIDTHVLIYYGDYSDFSEGNGSFLPNAPTKYGFDTTHTNTAFTLRLIQYG
jgi:hypothetical protein